jgi:hypothetical protein
MLSRGSVMSNQQIMDVRKLETSKHEAIMHSPAAILAPDHILRGIMESVEPTGVQDGPPACMRVRDG